MTMPPPTCNEISARIRYVFAAALHRGGNAHCLAVLRHGAASDIDALRLEQFDDPLVRQGLVRRLALNEAADAKADRLGRMCVATMRGGDRRGEEILQLE